MSNNFVRDPIDHGDFNVWLPLLLAGIHAGGIGALSAELYNDGGVLKLSKGNIGIDNGLATGKGICIIDTITTISTVGMTANNWHKVEVSVSGTAVTIAIAAIAGATDESTIDTVTKSAYQYDKQGYYLTASKRLIGVVFLRTALALGRIVNCESGKLGFKRIARKTYYNSALVESIKYYDTIRLLYLHWNMDITVNISIPLPYSMLYTSEHSFNVTIENVAHSKICGSVDAGLDTIGIIWGSYNAIYLTRVTGGSFDAASYNDASVIVELTYET